ncbi:lysophospholipase L1-like esterase [Mucilaginibacter sp. UYNi724]
MQNEELEEKVTMLEELIQGFVARINVVETEMPEFLKTFLQQYKEALDRIAARIETANKRYDDAKIQQQIDEVKKLVATVPKVIGVKTSHHFGAWSKGLIIGIVICFLATSLSVGTALFLNHQNDRLNDEAYNFWLVRALYPDVSKTIEKKLTEDPKSLNQQAEKAMEKQEAVMAAQAQAEKADKELKAARNKLEKVKSDK